MRTLLLDRFVALASAALAMLLAIGTATAAPAQTAAETSNTTSQDETPPKAISLEELVRKLHAERDRRTPDDIEFARRYVGATTTWFQRLSDDGKPFEERQSAFQLALEAAERFGAPSDEMLLVDDWSGQLFEVQRHEEAETLLRRVVDRVDAAGDSLPFLLERYAQAAHRRGDLGEALTRLERAQAAIERMSEDAGWRSAARLAVGFTRAQVEFDAGRIDVAYARLRAVRDEPGLASDPVLKLRADVTFGQFALAINDYAQVDEIVTEELVQRARTHDPKQASAALFLCAAARYKEARDHGGDVELTRKLLVEVTESTADPEIESAARLLLVNLELDAGDLTQAREQLAHVDALGPIDADSRARLAALRVAVTLAEGASRTQLEELSRQLRNVLDSLRDRFRSLPVQKSGVGWLYWGTTRMAFAEWVRLQLALDPTESGVAKALAPIVEAQGLGSLARSLDARATLGDVQRALVAPGVGVLVYLPTPNHSHVFALDSQGILHVELEREFDLRNKAEALESSWNATPSSDLGALEVRRTLIERAGRAAADAYLPPELRARIASWNICIVNGAELCWNPSFECFVLADGRFLGLTKGIVYLPSLPLGVRLCEREASRARPRGPEAVLVAAIGLDSSAPASGHPRAPIRANDDDVRRVMAAFEAGGVETRLRERASLEALREPAVASASVLSVLAHGAYDVSQCGADERPAYLLLAPSEGSSGNVCCAAVESLRLPALVELLACGTARGPTRMGDGAAAHLVGAGLLGGAGAVLASRTEVELDATLALATLFHEALRNAGLAPATALLEARRKISQTPGREDPWYWAGLALHGHACVPLFAATEIAASVPDERGSTLWKWSALAVAVAIASAFVVHRLRRRSRPSS